MLHGRLADRGRGRPSDHAGRLHEPGGAGTRLLRPGVFPTADPRVADRGVELALAAAGVVLGATLLGIGIGEKGVWLDESLSIARAAQPIDALWREITSTQANMGLYYLLLHVWQPFSGTAEAGVRALSMLFAVVTLPAAWLLARRLFGSPAALATLALLGLNSFFIRYGQEARGYSLVALLTTLASLTFVRALDRPESRRRWLAYVASGSLAVYAHLFGGFVLLAHAASLSRRPRRAWHTPGLAGAWLLIGVLVSPLAIFAVARDVGQIDWIPKPRPIDILHALRLLTGDAGWWLLALYGAAAGVTLVVDQAAARANGGDAAGGEPRAVPDAAVLAWAWFLLPLVVAFAVSMAKPVLQPRYLIVALPPLVMLAGAGVARLRPRLLGGAVLSGLLVWSATGTRDWYAAPERQHWRAAAAYVMAHAQPGDAIGFYVYSARVPFEYTVGRMGLGRGDVSFVDLTTEPWVAGNRQPDPSPIVLAGLARTQTRMWIVRLQDGTPPGHPLRRYEQGQAIEAALGETMVRMAAARFQGGIRIERYDRLPGR